MKNACRPPKGMTYLTIGQDLFSIQEYVNESYNRSLHLGRIDTIESFAPAAAMVYTDLENLKGLDQPTDYGSGIEYANGILGSLFPNVDVGLQIGLWLNGSYGCREILNGKMDNQINALTEYLLKSKASTIFLRLGYEFDNPFFGYSDDPKAYVLAYQKIVDDIEKNFFLSSKSKVQFVWHSWAAPRKNGLSLKQFYPGDSYVDWVGISVFQQVYPWSSSWREGNVDWGGQYADMVDVLQFATDHDKPTMIAESTPFGGINMNTSETELYNKTDSWDRWYSEVLALIERFDISMWSYINCNWESQPMWKGVGFGDTRLSSNIEVMSKWAYYVQNSGGKQRFLTGNSLKHCKMEREMEFKLQSPLLKESMAHYSFAAMFAITLTLLVLSISGVRRALLRHERAVSAESRSLL